MSKFVYFFSGTEKFLVDTKIKNLIRELGVDEYNIVTYDLDESSLNDAINDAMTIPFMSEKKVVILKNPHFLTNVKVKSIFDHDPKLLSHYVKAPVETTTLIIKSYYAKLDNRKQVTKDVMAHSEFIECNQVSGDQLKPWIIAQCNKKSITINRDALEELLFRCNSDMQLITSELAKLFQYIGDETTITLAMIQDIVPKNLEENVFSLTNAMFDRKKNETLKIYYELMESLVDPIMILGTLSNYIRNVMLVKEMLLSDYNQEQIQEELNLSKGRAYYSIKTANTQSIDTITYLVESLAELDYKIKSGLIDKMVGLELFMLSL